MSKQPPPAPTASTIGPCPTAIQLSRTPRHWKFAQHLRTTRPPPRRDDTLKDTNTFVFIFNTSILPKQLKVAFLRVSVDPYIPNPLRCYAFQVFRHHENNCHREAICANCGQPKHSADETDCKRPPKRVNCKEDHPANSKQCQAWHTEKESLKYTRNISFPEARKIVDSYKAVPGKSYASITKTVGVTVSCVDAATQTEPDLITAAPQSSSYNAASAEASVSTQSETSETLSQKERQKQEKADKTRQQELLTRNSGERRNLYQVQIGSRKDLMIQLGSIIGFPLLKS